MKVSCKHSSLLFECYQWIYLTNQVVRINVKKKCVSAKTTDELNFLVSLVSVFLVKTLLKLWLGLRRKTTWLCSGKHHVLA